jgi:hypothetical protein
MIFKVLFWLALAFDVCAIGLLFFLGLAAAGPSQTNPLEVVGKLLILPVLCLAGLAFWFLRVPSTGSRLLATLVVASPLLLVALGAATTGVGMVLHPAETRKEMSFQPVPLSDLHNAVLANDLAEVKRAAAAAKLKGRTDVGGVLILSLLRIERSPEQLPVLEALLAAGADPNRSDGTLPLEHALQRKLAEATRLLIRAGADPNARNRLGEPVYFEAISDPEMLKIILNLGGDANAKSFRGESALSKALALNQQQSARLLIEHGAK